MKPENITDLDFKLLKEKYPNNLEEILERVKNHYPVQYLIGNVDFYNCIISVNENVLIPRFETELFVEKVIQKLTKLKLENPNIIDLGCGSGCISISIKKHIPCNMNAVDISESAIELAKENAKRNHTKITFFKEDITTMKLDNYDVIISNPPYVSYEEKVGAETKYEPQTAIFAEENGLYFYKRILKNISKLKKMPKFIAFEIGMNQAEKIKEFAKELLPKYDFSCEKDYQNRNRFVFLEKTKE